MLPNKSHGDTNTPSEGIFLRKVKPRNSTHTSPHLDSKPRWPPVPPVLVSGIASHSSLKPSGILVFPRACHLPSMREQAQISFEIKSTGCFLLLQMTEISRLPRISQIRTAFYLQSLDFGGEADSGLCVLDLAKPTSLHQPQPPNICLLHFRHVSLQCRL